MFFGQMAHPCVSLKLFINIYWLSPHLSLLCCVDESMQKLFEGGKGSVFQRVLSWIPSHNHQLQLAGALAIANFARNGKFTAHSGAPFSSVGRARVPCAEALQRTWVPLPARVPLLRVTPPLSPPVSCHIFSCTINKTIKGQKNTFSFTAHSGEMSSRRKVTDQNVYCACL